MHYPSRPYCGGYGMTFAEELASLVIGMGVLLLFIVVLFKLFDKETR